VCVLVNRGGGGGGLTPNELSLMVNGIGAKITDANLLFYFYFIVLLSVLGVHQKEKVNDSYYYFTLTLTLSHTSFFMLFFSNFSQEGCLPSFKWHAA
jgi:hypothetical protein